MNLLFHCVHDTISLAMYEDLAAAARAAGHDVSFFLAGGIDRDVAHARLLDLGFPVVASVTDAAPDFMFVADFRCYERPRTGRVIDLGHGIGSKGSYYTPSTAYASDVVFFPSQHLIDRVRRPEHTAQFYSVGMPKLDAVFSVRAHRKPEQKPVVLIAPTYNAEYNCLALVAPYLEELSRDVQIIVKPHEAFFTLPSPHTRLWRPFLTEPPAGVRVVRSPNIAPWLAIADVVVSDVSSVFMEALACNIPTVVMESGFMREEKRIKRHAANEYHFQSGATVLRHGKALLEQLPRILANDPQEGARHRVAKNILDFPGTAIPRVLSLLPTL